MPKANKTLWIAVGIFLAFVAWICLEAAGAVPERVKWIAVGLPEWAFAVNIGLAPILAGLASSNIAIRAELRLLSFILLLVSISMFGLCYRRHPVITLIIGAFLYLEAFWIIPRWNARHRNSESVPPKS